MENNPPEKTSSFIRRENETVQEPNSPAPESTTEVVDVNPELDNETENRDNQQETEKTQEDQEPSSDANCSLVHISKDIDKFLLTLSRQNEESDVVREIPVFVEQFLFLVEAKIVKYESGGEGPAKWLHGSSEENEDTSFMEDVDRISKLATSFEEIKSKLNDVASLFNRIGRILQRAMSFLEDEFRSLLEDSKSTDPDPGDSKMKQESSDHSSLQPESDQSAGTDQVDYPGYSNDVVSDLNRIAKAMIAGGYETECCQVYIITRRNAFDESINKLGFDRISIDDVQKMQWESLEREIATWINTFKQCTNVYFSGERQLAESVFSDHPSVIQILFSNLAHLVLIQLLNFAEAVAMTKRAAEKLFKFLDMYETLRDIVPAMDGLFFDECADEVKAEISSARCRLGEAAVCIFCELENSIKSDTGKTPVPGGAVHPLTRYTMNYLKYACEYKDTLEQVFKEHQKIERADSSSRSEYQIPNQHQHADHPAAAGNQSPFSVQLIRVMDLLDTNLQVKSKSYKDLSLSYIFLMNNGRYIVQKIKGSKEIYDLMGDTWYRKRSLDLRNYHKSYQRETWNKLLGCLSHEGLNVNGKVVKPVLKERFKSFSTMFDEIHKTQSTWVVCDEQLQSELRVSISSIMIPAYRSFFGRFSQYLDPGRQTEKYIKFQPEDIETYVEDLFDGNPQPMGKKKP